MPEKLLVEIDMQNSDLEDAIPALIFLANEIIEAGSIEISSPVNWNEKQGSNYQVKWRFAEDELRIPFDVNFLYELNDELKNLTARNKPYAIVNFQKRLESCLSENNIRLFDDD